jgi:DNA polymerase elongation subunit (family B)
VTERAYVNGFVDGSELVLLFRDGGKLGAHRRPADWSSFHAPDALTPELLRELRESQCVAAISRDREHLRVRYKSPEYRGSVVRWLREEHGVESYEGDVDAFRRFFADSGATVQRPRRVHLDIETDSRVPPAVARRGKARVLCWSLVDPDERVVSARVLRDDSDDAERELLEALWEALTPFDQVCAWFGDDFDFPIVKLRSNALGARGRTADRWLWMDQMVLYERMNKQAAESGDEKESLALESVCRYHLKEGKGEFDASKTWEAWEAGGAERLRMLRYCVRDTALLARLEKKLGHLAINDAICEIARTFADTQSANPTSYVDAYLLRLYQERGMRAPTRVWEPDAGKREQFAGAAVLEPQETGIVKDVHCVDFSGMYPSIILTWNMSPETVDPLVAVNGPVPPGRSRAPMTRVGFRTAPKGMLPIFMEDVRRLRKYWSKKQRDAAPGSPEWWDAYRKSTAYKVIANAAYGVMGSPFSRFHKRAVAESTSTTGVYLIHQTMDAARERSIAPIYSDTDSAMVRGVTREQVGEFVAWCNAELYPRLAREHGCAENHLELAYEKEFERVVFLKVKKRYVGVYRHFKGTATCTCTTDEGEPGALDVKTMTCRDCGLHHEQFPPPRGKPEIRGLEYKRGDTFRLTRQLQFEVIEKLLVDLSEDAADFVPIVDRYFRHALEEPLPLEEVAQSQSLGKPLKEYEKSVKVKKDGTPTAEPVHVRVARLLKSRGELVDEGTRVSYVVVDATVTPQSVIPAADYAGECDRHYLWEAVWKPTRALLEAAFPRHDWGGYDKTRPGKKWEEAAKRGQGELAGVAGNPGSRRPRKPRNDAQAGLFAPPPAAYTSPEQDGPFVVEMAGTGDEREDARARLRVKAALREHPGPREVELRVGGRLVELGLCVAVSPELVRAVERAKQSASA